MVLMGQSAGAGLVGQQSLAFPDDPIVTGYITQSGAAWDVRSIYTDTNFANFTFVAQRFGCSGSLANLTTCMRQVPQDDVEAFIKYWVDAGQTPALSFQSKADDSTTFANATVAYLGGHYAKLPKIISHCEASVPSPGILDMH